MNTRIVAATLGLALSAGIGLGQAHAQTAAITIYDNAGYNIRARAVTPSGTTAWSGTLNLGSSVVAKVAIGTAWARIELEYNNGSSWKSLCSETITPVTSGKVTANGTLFNKSCSLTKY